MANTKSALKAVRRTERQTARNKTVKTRLKTLRKKYLAANAGEDSAATKQAAIALVSAMDKAAKTGIIHKNVASRTKAHVAAATNAKA